MTHTVHAAILFPELPVSSLRDPGTARVTLPTEAVRTVRGIVETALERPGVAVIARVVGEWGTGKTHLLLAARGALEQECERLALGAPFVLAVSATDTDFLRWYKEGVAHELAAGLAEEIVTVVYARAAADVARRSRLTSGAADLIEHNPALSLRYVELNHLNATAVDGPFVDLVAAGCRDAPTTVERALVHLVGAHRDIARAWIAGRRLDERDVALTGLSPSIENEDTAIAVLGALAGVAVQARRPFLVLVDELEYLIRHDSKSGESSNQRWLKRLLERLGSRGAIMLVAGHPTAWETDRDFMQRFTPGHSIELRPLEAGHVRGIADLFSRRENAIDEATADAVVLHSGGNVRRVLSLLRDLAMVTNSFARMPSEEEIARASERLVERVDPEAGMAHLIHILESQGLSVSSGGEVLPGIPVDLVASLDGAPTLVAERKSSVYQAKQHDQIQTFLERLNTVRQTYPHTLGLFISDGAVDPRIEELIAAGDADVYALDITRPDFRDRVRPVAARAAARQGPVDAARVGRATRKLIGAVEEVKRVDAPLYKEIASRVSTEAPNLGLTAVAQLTPRDEARMMYDELTVRPGVTGRMRILFNSPVALMLGILPLVAIVLIIIGPDLGLALVAPSSARDEATIKLVPRLIASALFFVSFAVVVARVFALDNFYDIRDSVLRERLLSGASGLELSRVGNDLQGALSARGPYFARGYALRQDYRAEDAR